MILTTHLFSAFWARKVDSFRQGWYKFSQNSLSLVALVIIVIIVLIAALAPYITPYPKHAGAFVNLKDRMLPPSLTHLFGTDYVGRDIFSRVLFGYRFSLLLAGVVLGLGVPTGIILGLIAGYYSGTWIDSVIMRITEVFLAVPPLLLALAVCAVLKPNLFNAMIAVSLTWWPYYCRLMYVRVTSLLNEHFVDAAELIGASTMHILLREIFPNCIPIIFTKMTLDTGLVIIIGSALSFVGLGVQPPKPGLGTMIASGADFLPAQWWLCIFPALAIMLVVLGFNLLGDGLRDLFTA